MSIKQMPFEEGQALNIRECPKLMPKDTTIEELKKLMEDDKIKIVKSGKSYYDVTSKPEIFEQAYEDFNIESLTKIEQRDLRQSEITPAFTETEDVDPMAALFKNTSQDEEEIEELETKTYYLRPAQIQALNSIALKEYKDKSEMAREFFDTAIKIKSEEHGIDFLAEAEKNLLEKPKKPRRRRKRK